uniref:Uncharacterized protein n=1 Tax=Heterorhabditis bacteriophora TaxID=37862 RepID=A0A1I7WHF5_HETBA
MAIYICFCIKIFKISLKSINFNNPLKSYFPPGISILSLPHPHKLNLVHVVLY